MSNFDDAITLGEAITVIDAAFLLGPPLAAGVYFMVRLRSRRALSWTLKFVVASLAIILFAAIIGLRFTAVSANIACVALMWPAWCFCWVCGCRAKGRPVRVLSWIVAVLSVALGYLLGTVGTLGAAFIIGDIVRTPTDSQSFQAPDRVCETTLWGGPGAGDGTSVVLYRRWAAVPWLRFRLAEVSVDELAGAQGVSCADLATPK